MRFKKNNQTGEVFCFFWKKEDVFSQWHYSVFHGKSEYFGGDRKFINCEQWMMYNKALLFDDLVSAEKIMLEKDPSKIKKIGRDIIGYDVKIWDKEKFKIVIKGNKLKFEQNIDMCNTLMGTKCSTLAEASPYDKIYGIGLDCDDVNALYPDKWRGKNLLGKALQVLRDEIFDQNININNDICIESDDICIESDEEGDICSFINENDNKIIIIHLQILVKRKIIINKIVLCTILIIINEDIIDPIVIMT
jgi:ribA/ribD-fused uncharacterized protein